ncbi:hypothetical protein GCM10011357_12190 [Lacimicrobium alkaliphilum]|uniref:Uncharacterized protein n=1 Tax=Lacimicrobium alkaliphilum TaxID=1526571 RepID=A0ABQ1R782_9ALTE|nr:hypothetical protein GCM10011357_12190 [Lacimicrobium alkaliphilum]
MIYCPHLKYNQNDFEVNINVKKLLMKLNLVSCFFIKPFKISVLMLGFFVLLGFMLPFVCDFEVLLC